jgi:hypothetical protein
MVAELHEERIGAERPVSGVVDGAEIRIEPLDGGEIAGAPAASFGRVDMRRRER